MQKILTALELNGVYGRRILCEPQLGKRGLYPTLSTVGSATQHVKNMMNLLVFADGKTSLMEIADIIGINIFECATIARQLQDKEVLFLTD